MDAPPSNPRRPSRAARVGWALMGFAWCGVAIYLFVQFVGTTSDAGVLLVRGEVVPATVVEVELHRKLGREDLLVVTTDPPYSGRADVATFREDIPVGAVVEVVVDPADPTRASLAEDGWPWYATLFPLVLLPFAALGALLSLGKALGGPQPEHAEEDAEEDEAPPRHGTGETVS